MLSPSPSPQAASVDSSSQQFYSTATSDMLQHPQAQMHPSLLYHSPSPAFDSSSSYNGNPMAHLPPSESPPPGGAGKRYRSAPAKTFQCAGYGECRMVFSRSEHLARHIRCVFSSVIFLYIPLCAHSTPLSYPLLSHTRDPPFLSPRLPIAYCIRPSAPSAFAYVRAVTDADAPKPS
ncbi:hypothetical protein B0H19DRAFT_1138722 [Mycena capillaripes]|nr:hypothetical protein B0H19DRAFT_1138722 [Mycena capillaripes]